MAIKEVLKSAIARLTGEKSSFGPPEGSVVIYLDEREDLMFVQQILMRRADVPERTRWTPMEHFHITVAHAPLVDEEDFNDIYQEIAGLILSEPLRIESVGSFETGGATTPIVAFVEKTPILEALHQRVFEAFADRGITLSEYSQPDAWVPHITLGYFPSQNAWDVEMPGDFTVQPFSLAFTRSRYETVDASVLEPVQVEFKTTLITDAENGLWFFGVFSNNFEDMQGETISWNAHLENAAWLKANDIHPPITVFHEPQFPPLFHIVHVLSTLNGDISYKEYSDNLRELYKSVAIAEARAVIPMNNFIFVVGKVYDNKRELAERLKARSKTWGMSHGFIRLRSHDTVTEKYRSFEYSILPTVTAANRITPIGFVEKGELPMDDIVKQLSAEDRALLDDLLDGSADDLETATSKARDILQRVLGSKSFTESVEASTEETPIEEVAEETQEDTTEEAPVEEAAEEVVSKSYVEMRDQIVVDLKVPELIATLKATGDTILALEGKLEKLETEVAALKMDDDTKIASQFTAPDWSLGFKRAPVERPTDDDAALLAKLKQFVEGQTIVEPEDEKGKDNPLYTGFYRMFN